MTEAKRAASLSEWAAKFKELIDQAEADGISVEETPCCCSSGVRLVRPNEEEEWVL